MDFKVKQILSHVTYGGKEYTRYQVEQSQYVYWHEGHLSVHDVANLEHCEARQVQSTIAMELESKFTFADKQVDITACPNCRGVGFTREIYSGNPGDYRDNVRCSICGGTGKKQQDDGDRNLEAPSQES